MGNGSKGARNDGSNDAGPGRDVQGGGAFGAIIKHRELVGDYGDAQGPGWVPPLGGAKDHKDDGKMRGKQRVGVLLVSGGDGSRGDPPHCVVHQEAEVEHSGEGCLLPRLYTVYGGREDARDEAVGAMVGPRRGKWTWLVDEEEV